MFSTSSASPSVITSSGATVALARRPPITGRVPIGLARISPSRAKQSAIAAAHTSARVGGPSITYRPLILVLSHVDIPRPEGFPRFVGLRRRRICALELLVARIVGDTFGEVRAVRCL